MPLTSDTSDPEGARAPFGNGRELDVSAGTVYNLRGFLRCMAAEGRQLPDAEAIEHLEHILDTRDAATGGLVCELMAQEDVPRMMGGKLPEQVRKRVYAKKYGGLTTDRWGTLYPGRFTGDVTKMKPGEWVRSA